MRIALLALLFGCTTEHEVIAAKPKPKARCPRPYVEYRNGTHPHPQDDIQIEVASKRCGQLYANSPCVIKIIKVGDFDYHAVCGAPK